MNPLTKMTFCFLALLFIVPATASAQMIELDEASPAAREQYLEQYVAFEDWVGIDQYGNAVARWTVPYKGRFKEELRGATFYEYVEQPDLAKKFRRRSTTKWTIFGASLAAQLGGATYAVLGAGDLADGSTTKFLAGMTIMGVGSVTMMVGLLLNPHPVSPSEARRLAHDFNERLARRLGIGTESPDDDRQENDAEPLQNVRTIVAPVEGGVVAGVGFEW